MSRAPAPPDRPAVPRRDRALRVWTLLPIYLITVGAFSTQDAIYSYPLPALAEASVSIVDARLLHPLGGTLPSLERSV